MANIAKLLTEYIDIWTAAESEKKSGRGRASGNTGSVYGVKKLRELILELAVRGKLVLQDPNDEPARELLKRIQAEKAKLIAEGKLKKEKPLVPISEDEKPFELPVGWTWVRNTELFQLRKGRIPKTLNEDGVGLPYLDIDALDRNTIRRYSEELTCPQSTDRDILVVCDGSRSGLVLDGKNGIIGSTLAIIDTPTFIQNYIKLIFKQGFESFNTSMKGAAIPHLDTQKLLQNLTALPSLAEQHRIVAKVDELMALCDQLEQQHSNAQEVHETLVGQLLATLTQSQNAAEFNANWQRIYAHFDVLFTTETSIDALKQTLLQLAVMGKLAPQDPNDEPASELLKRIQAENAKSLALIAGDEKPFDLPQGWNWSPLQDLLNPHREISYGIIKLGVEPKSRGMPVLRCSDVKPGFISLDAVRKVSEEIEKEYVRTRLQGGEILLNIRGTLGGVALVTEELIGFNVAREVAVVPISNYINGEYITFVMLSNYFWQAILEGLRGIAYVGLNLRDLRQFLIPVPPLTEQHRIIAKVDTLMALCDQLKTRIQQANQQQQSIADVLVAQAAT